MEKFHNLPAVTDIMKQIRFDPWNLTGNHNRFNRQEFLKHITGEKYPLGRCGVNAIEAALNERIDVSGMTYQANLKTIYKQHFTGANCPD